MDCSAEWDSHYSHRTTMNCVKLFVATYKRCDKTLIAFLKKWLNTATKITKMYFNEPVRNAYVFTSLL